MGSKLQLNTGQLDIQFNLCSEALTVCYMSQ